MMPRNKTVIPVLVFLLVFFTSSVAVGETVLQPGPEDGIDTYILSLGDYLVGDSPVMSAESNNADVYYWIWVFSLVKFDLPTSLVAEDIASAQLELYEYLPLNAPTTVNVHRVLKPWEESSVWSDFPSLTNYPTSQDLFEDTAESFFSATGPGWMSFDVTNLVKDWISNPESNYGVLLEIPYSEVPSGGVKGVNMWTSDSGNSGYRPKLTIYYGETVPATIDIHPDTLNLKSKGKWVTCYIELPEGNDLEDIDIGSIAIVSIAVNGVETNKINISAKLYPTEVGDYDNDGIPDLMVKFEREAVQDAASPGVAEITINCETYGGGTAFEGSDTVLIIDKGQVHYSEDHGSVAY